MKLRVKKGAVIKVELMGMSQPIYKIGKVDRHFYDEIVLIEQGKQGMSQKETVDLQELHINRELIASWEYAHIDCIKEVNHPYQVTMLNINNGRNYTKYNDIGFCYGEDTNLE